MHDQPTNKLIIIIIIIIIITTTTTTRRKWREAVEDWTAGSFITCTLHKPFGS
jgi:hypothetical protein